MKKAVLIALVACGIAAAQIGGGGGSAGIQRVSALPASCTTGQVVSLTTGAKGICQCSATDTWTCSSSSASYVSVHVVTSTSSCSWVNQGPGTSCTASSTSGTGSAPGAVIIDNLNQPVKWASCYANASPSGILGGLTAAGTVRDVTISNTNNTTTITFSQDVDVYCGISGPQGTLGPAGPTGPTGPAGAAGPAGFSSAFSATPQSVTSGVTASVTVPFNATIADISDVLPSCTVAADGSGTAAWSAYNTSPTQMIIHFDTGGMTTANFTGTCTAVGNGGTARYLFNAATICQAGAQAGSAFSWGASAAPTPACEADGGSGYLSFAAGTAQTVYAMFRIPSVWSGAANLTIEGWSTGTAAPTIAVTHYCAATGTAISGGTYANSQSPTITMQASSGLSQVTQSLDVTGCSAGDEYRMKITITGNTTDFNLIRASVM